MIVSILFLFAFIISCSGIVFYYKTPNKMSIIRSMIAGVVINMCFGSVLAQVYNILKIPIQIQSMAVGYFILAVCIWGITLKKRQVQKMNLPREDIYAVFVITLFFMVFFFKTFGPKMGIVSQSWDIVMHYRMARGIMLTHKIDSMYFNALYNAMVMELFEPLLVPLSLYKAFNIADAFANYLNLLVFYLLLTQFFKNRTSKMAAPFVCIVYFMGWPLCSYLICSFCYFGMGVMLYTFTIYVLLVIHKIKEKKLRKNLFAVLILLLYSVGVCYMLLMPSLLLITLLGGVILLKRESIKIPVRWLIAGGCIVLALGIVIFSICFWGYFDGHISLVFASLKLDGWNFCELYKDFLFLAPIMVYACQKNRENRECNMVYISLGVILLYIAGTFILLIVGQISTYYFYKMYYPLWMTAWVVAFDGGVDLAWKYRRIFTAYIVPVGVAFVLTVSGIESALISKGIMNKDSQMFPIISESVSYALNCSETDEMRALRYAVAFIKEKNLSVTAIGERRYVGWYENYSGFPAYEVGTVSVDELDEIIGELADNYEYVLISKAASIYQENREYFAGYSTVYEDGVAAVYVVRE